MKQTFWARCPACDFTEEGGCLLVVVKAKSKHATLKTMDIKNARVYTVWNSYAAREDMEELQVLM